MDVTRAQEILKSPEKITVVHEGVPVWIDEVIPQTGYVRVHAEDNPADVRRVTADQLEER